MGEGPISPVPIDVGTVCVRWSPVDIEAVPIPENRMDTGTVHAHANMPTGVQTPQKSDGHIMLLWML